MYRMCIRFFYWCFRSGCSTWSKLGLRLACLWYRPYAGSRPLVKSNLKKRRVKTFEPGDLVVCEKSEWLKQDLQVNIIPKVGEVHKVLETHNFSNIQLLWFSYADDAPAFPATSFRLFHDHNVERIMKEIGGYPKKIR